MKIYKDSLNEVQEGEGDLQSVAWDLLSAARGVAEKSYLAGRFEICREWCGHVGDAACYFLLGDWMEKVPNDDGIIDPHCWYEAQPCWTWTLYLEMGLGWSAIGGAWDIVDSLCEFLTPKIEYDDEGGKVGREYYLALADWLRGNDVSRVEEVKRLRGSGSKSYHLLCDIMTAIEDGQEAQLAKAFTVYVKHFLKRRRHEQHFPLDATFLWNYAKKKGVRCELAEDTSIYLFELPTE